MDGHVPEHDEDPADKEHEGDQEADRENRNLHNPARGKAPGSTQGSNRQEQHNHQCKAEDEDQGCVVVFAIGSRDNNA